MGFIIACVELCSPANRGKRVSRMGRVGRLFNVNTSIADNESHF
jgi:hypothetical protein